MLELVRTFPALASLVLVLCTGGLSAAWTHLVTLPAARNAERALVTAELTREFETAAAATRAAREMRWQQLAREIEADQEAALRAAQDEARAREAVLQQEIERYEALCDASGDCSTVSQRDLDWWLLNQPGATGGRSAGKR